MYCSRLTSLTSTCVKYIVLTVLYLAAPTWNNSILKGLNYFHVQWLKYGVACPSAEVQQLAYRLP